ncbi:MAG: hypothetical protein K0R27_3460 [Xanthobacteraceae bacterium]|jgi:hypothetical protein|nr:hypothetical protein [Xanthobacteraceae bacterium]
MPLKCEGYDPEAISLLQQCLDIATEAACTATGALPSEELRQRLAIALLEGPRPTSVIALN